MRRPLIQPDGVPFLQAAFGVATLFDTSDVDPSVAYEATVFAWFPQGEATNLSIGVETGGVVIPTGIWLAAGSPIDAFRINGNGPALVMDKYVVRGGQKVVVVTAAGGYGPSGVTWFGHIEEVGRSPESEEYRSLQPDNDLSLLPFPPTFITVPAAGGTVSAPVHLLDNSNARYLDELNVFVSCVAGAGPAGSPACRLKVLGVDIPVPVLDAGTAGSPIRLFDGIPMRAPAIDDNLLTLEVDAADNVGLTAVCYGRFQRRA